MLRKYDIAILKKFSENLRVWIKINPFVHRLLTGYLKPFMSPVHPPVTIGQRVGAVGCVDQLGPELISGWIYWPDDPARLSTLSFHEGSHRLLEIKADGWREDIAELRQGDGRCGFSFPVPEELRDGRAHVIDIREVGSSRSLLSRHLILAPIEPKVSTEISGRVSRVYSVEARKVLAPMIVDRPPATVELSIVVNFYNMQREAARTLTSLSRQYQQDIGDTPYEVLCIDNGSNPPLDREWVESFGPEFRLISPSRLLPSPCFAINEAARQAGGRHIAIMIDGAHVLTPGVFREVLEAIREKPKAVVAIRHWFIGGDQRWLSTVGYTREMEDALFARIQWPADGYGLFEISAPMFESPNYWFGGLSESNCLFLPVETYDGIGGFDEAFDEPGAGYANLDLFRRAAEATEDVVCLVGEATMHQFHGGMTTNVSDAEKESRVRAYAASYSELRGGAFENFPPERIQLRGGIKTRYALVARQRPLFPAALGVTERIRPGSIPQHFDQDAQKYLQSAYVECDNSRYTKWLGQPIDLAPPDLLSIQDILHEIRPARIVATGIEDGLVSFICATLDRLELSGTRIIRVISSPNGEAVDNRIDVVGGAPYAEKTLSEIDRLIGAEEVVLVLFGPQSTDFFPAEQLAAYTKFVSYNSYLIFLRTAHGQPWLGYSKYWFLAAINRLVSGSDSFVVDETRTPHFITLCPSGFLKRAKDMARIEAYDETLDDLDLLVR